MLLKEVLYALVFFFPGFSDEYKVKKEQFT